MYNCVASWQSLGLFHQFSPLVRQTNLHTSFLHGYPPLCRFLHDHVETFSALLAICARNWPVPGEFPTQRPVTWSFDGFFICVRINGWVNNRKAGDLRRYRAHYDASVMIHVYANLCHFGCQEFAPSAIHRRNWKQSNSSCSASWPFFMFFASTINA